MKRMGVVPIDFRRADSGALVPVDAQLFALVTEYCQFELSEQPDLDKLVKTWAVVEFDEDRLVAVHGVAAYAGNVPDVPLFRVTGDNAKRATQMLYDRMNGFFADNGLRGKQVFLFLNEKETPEQRCPAYEESLKEVGAVPAQRLAVTVR
jgi:hypothetical protein